VDIKTILRRIENGDRSAFAAVVRHFQHPLFGYLGRLGLAQAVAEEIAQETFIRVWKQLNDYDASRAEFSTWLFTIARNLALHELKRAANKYEVVNDEASSDAAGGHNPSDALDHVQTRQALLDALRRLPLEDRSALALAYLQEFDLATVARIEGCRPGAIKVRLHRAKQKLRQLLEKDDE